MAKRFKGTSSKSWMSFITWTIEFCIISTVSTPTSFLNSSPKGSADFTVLEKRTLHR